MIVYNAPSQILLDRIEAEKLNTKLIYCEKLQIYCDSLAAVAQSYTLLIQTLSNKNKLLKRAIAADSIAYYNISLALDICKADRTQLKKDYISQGAKLKKIRRRRWWLVGGGIVAGFVGGVLIAK